MVRNEAVNKLVLFPRRVKFPFNCIPADKYGAGNIRNFQISLHGDLNNYMCANTASSVFTPSWIANAYPFPNELRRVLKTTNRPPPFDNTLIRGKFMNFRAEKKERKKRKREGKNVRSWSTNKNFGKKGRNLRFVKREARGRRGGKREGKENGFTEWNKKINTSLPFHSVIRYKRKRKLTCM